MELSIDPETAEWIWGVLSFIALIAWCRWEGTPEDQRELEKLPIKFAHHLGERAPMNFGVAPA